MTVCFTHKHNSPELTSSSSSDNLAFDLPTSPLNELIYPNVHSSYWSSLFLVRSPSTPPMHEKDSSHYKPFQSGRHCHPAAREPSEPFWWQYPTLVKVGSIVTYSDYYTIHLQPPSDKVMDCHVKEQAPVIIGSNTRNGRRTLATPVAIKPRDNPKPDPKSYRETVHYKMHKAMGMVEIQVGGVVVSEVELKTLVRFSKAAALKFPKPPRLNDINTNPANSDKRKVMNLDDPRFWQFPSPDAIQHVLDWMRKASKTIRGGIPPDCVVPETSDAEFGFRCEVYAATLLLDIRPRPKEAVDQLKRHITDTPPTLAMLQTVHELLPIDDVIMTRTITSYFEHVEPGDYKADPAEDVKIQQYVTDVEVDFELFKRFEDVQNARARWKTHEEQRAKAEAERLSEHGRVPGRRGKKNGNEVAGGHGQSSEQSQAKKWRKGKGGRQAVTATGHEQ